MSGWCVKTSLTLMAIYLQNPCLIFPFIDNALPLIWLVWTSFKRPHLPSFVTFMLFILTRGLSQQTLCLPYDRQFSSTRPVTITTFACSFRLSLGLSVQEIHSIWSVSHHAVPSLSSPFSINYVSSRHPPHLSPLLCLSCRFPRCPCDDICWIWLPDDIS